MEVLVSLQIKDTVVIESIKSVKTSKTSLIWDQRKKYLKLSLKYYFKRQRCAYYTRTMVI